MNRSPTTLLALLVLHSISDASAQYFNPPGQYGGYNTPLRHQSHYSNQGHSFWPFNQQNFNPSPQYLEPRNDAAGPMNNAAPSAQSCGYPQVFKFDNVIIVSSPTQQHCPQCPSKTPLVEPDDPSQSGDRAGNQPTKCTWAIVACCSPYSKKVRYNCFEMLGCPGFFFDETACSPNLVSAAAKATLDFYKNSSSSPDESSDSVTNRS